MLTITTIINKYISVAKWFRLELPQDRVRQKTVRNLHVQFYYTPARDIPYRKEIFAGQNLL